MSVMRSTAEFHQHTPKGTGLSLDCTESKETPCDAEHSGPDPSAHLKAQELPIPPISFKHSFLWDAGKQNATDYKGSVLGAVSLTKKQRDSLTCWTWDGINNNCTFHTD